MIDAPGGNIVPDADSAIAPPVFDVPLLPEVPVPPAVPLLPVLAAPVVVVLVMTPPPGLAFVVAVPLFAPVLGLVPVLPLPPPPHAANTRPPAVASNPPKNLRRDSGTIERRDRAVPARDTRRARSIRAPFR
ncbi:hypothetical protein [Paraburkholderia sp.]|jgi:hypothetical protein|uniref:hypothetical protein n=1 Tax=Paraburkholderia sp. TaxID=1926495 RepID=UPI002F426AB2